MPALCTIRVFTKPPDTVAVTTAPEPVVSLTVTEVEQLTAPLDQPYTSVTMTPAVLVPEFVYVFPIEDPLPERLSLPYH